MSSGTWSTLVSALSLVFVLEALTGCEAVVANVAFSPDEAPLLAFKQSIQNDPLRVLKDWVAGGLCRSWSHVVCNSNLRVTSLNLQDKGLVASSISPNLSSLTFLQTLNLQNNSFSGQIPFGLGALTSLQQLNIGTNPLNGSIPIEVFTLAGLSYLNVARTRVSGIISPSVANLANISFLHLDNTQLSGQIPREIGTLENLQILYLHQDISTQVAGLLTGPLPESLGSLSLLTELNVANNGLNGEIPDSFAKLQELRVLNVSGNQFSGQISVGVLQLSSLTILDISSNNFNGTVNPGSIQTFRYDSNPNLQVGCTSNCSRSSKSEVITTLIVAVVLCLVGTLAGVLGCAWYFKRRRREPKKRESGQVEEEHSATLYPYTPCLQTLKFTLNEIMVATNNLNPDNVVGSGGFGDVYKGTLANNDVVAVKHAAEMSQQDMHDFFTEVELLSHLHHNHLVNLIGYCAESGEQMLIYEYMPNGNLLQHLTGQRGVALTWRQRVRIAICAAKGLAYLHEGCSPPIIHGDLKPSNILLDSEDGAKVSHFGIEHSAGQSHVSTSIRGTPGYIDPYYYLSFHPSTSSDVYSFGVILLQLVTAKPAVDNSRKQAQYNIINWAKDSVERGDLEAIIDRELLKQEYNRGILLHMATLGLRCVAKDRKSRPTMGQVSQELDIVLRTHDTKSKMKEEMTSKNVDMSGLNDGESSRDFDEQESFYLGERANSFEGLQVGHVYGLPSRDASITDSTEFYRKSTESSDEEYARTPSSSGSVYVFPLDRGDSNIKFDGMSWVDIKNIDDEKLVQFSGAIAYEKRLQEFRGSIEISGELQTYYPKTTTNSTNHPTTSTGSKFTIKSAPL